MLPERPTLGSRHDVAACSRSWARLGSALDEPARRAVLAALFHQLERPASPDARWTASLYEFDPDLEFTVEEGRLLRAVLYELASGLPAAVALRFQRDGSLLIDDLVADAAQRRVSALEMTALLDPLTGLHNRRAATQSFDAALAHGRRHSRPVAIAVIDLVGLKQVNDTLGHAAGDASLRQLADAMVDGLRAGDSAFRIGGDEFVILAPDTSASDLELVIERLRPGAPEFTAGIAESIVDGDDAATLLALADARLYAARRGVVSTHPRQLRPFTIGLIALTLGAAGAVLAELVRNVGGVPVEAGATTAWRAILVVAPLLAGAAACVMGPADAPAAVRRAGGLGALTALALLALLAPLLDDQSNAERTRLVAAPTSGGSPTTLVPQAPSTLTTAVSRAKKAAVPRTVAAQVDAAATDETPTPTRLAASVRVTSVGASPVTSPPLPPPAPRTTTTTTTQPRPSPTTSPPLQTVAPASDTPPTAAGAGGEGDDRARGSGNDRDNGDDRGGDDRGGDHRGNRGDDNRDGRDRDDDRRNRGEPDSGDDRDDSDRPRGNGGDRGDEGRGSSDGGRGGDERSSGRGRNDR